MWGALITWGVINVIGFICLWILIKDSSRWFDILIYSLIERCLRRVGVPHKDAVVIEILLTIVLLPLAVVYFSLLILLSLIATIIAMVCGVWDVIFDRHKD